VQLGVILVVLGGALASCSGPDGEWRAVRIDGAPTPVRPEAVISFRDGRLSGGAGCNGYQARYRVFAHIIWTRELAGKAILCAGDRAVGMVLEDRVGKAMRGLTVYSRPDPDHLVLRSRKHALVLVARGSR
jgi:heat shock protein HslJ